MVSLRTHLPLKAAVRLMNPNGATRRRRVTRDGVLFAAGLAGVAYETLHSGGDRPTLLLLFAAMMGLPAFLQKDDKRTENGGDHDPTS